MKNNSHRHRNREKIEEVICDYCQGQAELVDSKEVYSRSYGLIWLCRFCNAWVGVHKNSKRHVPLGRLSNQELRNAKKKAHAAFDPLWKRKMVKDDCKQTDARKKGYFWLAKEMNIPASECHIGMFNVEQCNQVIQIVNSIRG